VEVIHSFDESRERRCGNRNSGGRLGCCKPPIQSPNASVAQINLSFRIPGGLRAIRKQPRYFLFADKPTGTRDSARLDKCIGLFSMTEVRLPSSMSAPSGSVLAPLPAAIFRFDLCPLIPRHPQRFPTPHAQNVSFAAAGSSDSSRDCLLLLKLDRHKRDPSLLGMASPVSCECGLLELLTSRES
jgi:hypothetical protein